MRVLGYSAHVYASIENSMKVDVIVSDVDYKATVDAMSEDEFNKMIGNK